jgi:hypothetical protein
MNSKPYLLSISSMQFFCEYRDGLFGVLPYFAARYLARLPVTVVLAVVYITPIYWLAGLQNDATSFGLYLLLFVITLLVAQALALTASAFVTDFKVSYNETQSKCTRCSRTRFSFTCFFP